MEKPRKRAERRWRSFRKWMRRLKADQATHVGPWSPKYSWDKNGVCTLVSYGDRTSLCECFDLTSRQATRFKDTPNGCNCWSCANPRRTFDGRSKESLTFQERKVFLGDREDWGKRKRRNGWRMVNIPCVRCGRTTCRVAVKYGKNRYSAFIAADRGRLCKLCSEKNAR